MFFPGFLINHYGSKKVAFVCAVGMAFTTALMPTLAFIGMYYFMAMRILFGIFEVSLRFLKFLLIIFGNSKN